MVTSERPPIGSRQEARSQASTKRLLEAAGELIVMGGYSAMTLAAVGERAGFSRGLATARFGSKDELLEALFDRIVTRWNYQNLLPLTTGKPGREQVFALLDAVRRQVERDSSALRVLYALMFEAIGPILELRIRFAEFHAQMRTDLAAIVRLGLRDGSIAKDISPDREAEMIIAGLRGIAYQWALDPEQFDPVPALAYFAATTERRLRP